ncbi:hypothetical protein ERX46_10340 [Brumimicrobium glaciale]|uniref:Histidine kinase N-terminal 7TM region domain-containing protein n=1 Tax=Brumimicrobium glaciale TaxID=200475 RepID=A0A4Q4KLT2_9FLAO|nr:DUF6629 family protein [Brumimicrobium glaciale]RYM33334.1 hypothetical protein ERX46_10340 [Brumimicrobium glaciale]
MCFSAEASFIAGAVLTVIGVATIKKTNHKSQLWFASIPLVFGIQQLAEGVLWLTLPDPDQIVLQRVATYIFIFFAQVIWPFIVPFGVLMLDHKRERKLIQKILAGVGIFVSGSLAYFLIAYNMEASILGHHIAYKQDYPETIYKYGAILYAAATILSLFLSNVKRMWLLGVFIATSYAITLYFYENHVLSVWCFFSSLISIYIYLIIRRESKKLEKA